MPTYNYKCVENNHIYTESRKMNEHLHSAEF